MNEKQIPDENPFPEFEIVTIPPWLSKLGNFVMEHLHPEPRTNSGGAVMLDRELYPLESDGYEAW